MQIGNDYKSITQDLTPLPNPNLFDSTAFTLYNKNNNERTFVQGNKEITFGFFY